MHTNSDNVEELGVVSQLTQPTEDGAEDAMKSILQSSRQRRAPRVPIFVGNEIGKALCVSILSLARSEGFENTLGYRKRKSWFESKTDFWFVFNNG